MYEIVKLTDDNIKDLVSLYENAFGKKTSEAYIKQKFSTEFTNHKNLGFIAYHESGEAAAFYGVLPCFTYVNGEKVLVAQSGHTMTHKKHRRAKLFIKLANHTFEYCKQKGFKAVYGFPNIYSYPSFVKKLNWNHFDDYHAFTPRVKCFPWIKVNKIFPPAKSLQKAVQKITIGLLKNSKAFSNSIQTDKHIVIEHDEPYFNYKKFENNYCKIIGGDNIWFKFNAMYLLLGDYESSRDLEYTHKRIKKLAFLLGIPHVRYQVSSNTDLYNFCIKSEFEKGNTYPIAGIALDESFPIDKMKFTLADFDTF